MTPLKFSQHVGRDFLPSVFLGGEGRERAVRQTAAEIREAHLLMLSKISLAERSTFVTRRCLELWVISDSVNHQEKNQAGQKNATKRVRNDHARAREPPEGERERERRIAWATAVAYVHAMDSGSFFPARQFSGYATCLKIPTNLKLVST